MDGQKLLRTLKMKREKSMEDRKNKLNKMAKHSMASKPAMEVMKKIPVYSRQLGFGLS